MGKHELNFDEECLSVKEVGKLFVLVRETGRQGGGETMSAMAESSEGTIGVVTHRVLRYVGGERRIGGAMAKKRD